MAVNQKSLTGEAGSMAASAGETNNNEVVIPYSPFAGMEKWLKYRFSAWSETKAWFVMTLVAIFFWVGGPGLLVSWVAEVLSRSVVHATPGAAAAITAASQAVLYYFFSGVGVLLAAAAGSYYAQPTHIGISSQGLRRLWRRRWLNVSGQLLSWEHVNHIRLLRPPGKTSPQDWLVCFQVNAGVPMRWRLGAIPTVQARADLLEALNCFAPATTRDAELRELLCPPQDHSYTELWLKALSAPPKRERLTPLPAGVTLKSKRYEILGQLGVGGQGTAYLAIDHGNDRQTQPEVELAAARQNGHLPRAVARNQEATEQVVLKESILPVYVEVNVRRESLERFQQEALMLSKLDHPQVVKLSDYFVEDHRSYLVLEHIDGMSLRQLVTAQGKLQETKVIDLALQMCCILSYLHGLVPPVVHRDFTPDNLILTSAGLLKLVDFNVAQQTELTTTGTVVGKHAYIPPEQFRGKPSPQSDIYALGATLFYLLTGEDPEPISQSHPFIQQADLSAQIDQIVARATAVDTTARFASAGELQTELLKIPKRLP